MRRNKSALTLHRRKRIRSALNTAQQLSQISIKSQLQTIKRKTLCSPARYPTNVCLLEMTPILSPVKSPLRSPLIKISPPNKRAKRIKSARVLFKACENTFPQNDKLEKCLLDFELDKVGIELNNDRNEVNVESVSNKTEYTHKELTETCNCALDTSALPCNEDKVEHIHDKRSIHKHGGVSSEEVQNESPDSEKSDAYIASKVHNSNENISDVAGKIQKLTPKVIELLASEDRLDLVLLQFFEQINDDRFPLANMSFRLWTEVVKWFECKSSTEMRDSEVTKQFWRLGYKLFGARFTNFMGGFKHHGQVISNTSIKGYYPPASASINFAVPNEKMLRQFSVYDNCGERTPGLFVDVIKTLSDNLKQKSCCLTFDGKKLKQGLTESAGDVDLLGFEMDLTLNDRKLVLQSGLQTIENMRKCLIESQNFISTNNSETNSNMKALQLEFLQTTTKSILDIRKLKSRKEYAKGKLIERGGNSDWRKGRYAFAVSAIIAFVYDIDNFLKHAVCVTDEINRYVSFLNGEVYSQSDIVDVNNHSKFYCIKDQRGSTDDTRLVPQKTEKWTKCRQSARITGSTLYYALGCDGLAKQRNHFDKVICNIAEREPTLQAKQAMEHGTRNEINAVATLLGRILPVLEPNLYFCEEGFVKIQVNEHEGFFVVSPDGSLRTDNSLNSTRVAIEIKCPVTKVHEEFPPRYYLQCLSEIESLNTDYLLFISWTEAETLVYKVERDQDLFQKALQLSVSLYGNDKPKRPTKLTDVQKALTQDIRKASKGIPIIGRFASCKLGVITVIALEPDVITKDDVEGLLSDMHDLSKTLYELKREKASEAVVFLVADLDRSWESEKIRAGPVAWFPKGYSLTVDTMRHIAEYVHTECHRNDIHIPCVSFDGQWHNVVTRSTDHKPLTIHQLHKDVWKAVEKRSKKDIISKIKEVNDVPQWSYVTVYDCDIRKHKKVINATNFGKRLPKLPANLPNPICEDNVETVETENVITLADVMPDTVQDTCDLNSKVLSMIELQQSLEIGAFSSNINETEWAMELIDEHTESNEQTTLFDHDFQHKENGEHNQDPVSNEAFQTGTQKAKSDSQEHKSLESKDFMCILRLLQTTGNCNKKGKWDNISTEKLAHYFKSKETLASLLDSELRVVMKYLKKVNVLKSLKESVPKLVKVREISQALHITGKMPPKLTNRKTSKTHNVKSLAEIATKCITKFRKEHLNVIQAEYEWPDAYSKWQTSMTNVKVNGAEYEWFYHPEFSSERQQYEVRCIDSTHLLTRARRKSCHGGLDGLSNRAWLSVAKSKRTLLTPIMITEVTDPMSAAMAKTHFSMHVETEMRQNGDSESADLCHDIRCWWEAEDKPGISALDRLHLRQHLRNRLISRKNFSEFPPATKYARGWPIQLWEGILASIDAKCMLYALTKSGTYNQRAFSSMIGETFFSEVSLHDKRGQGTLTSTEFGKHIGNTIEQIQTRLDPDRSFCYCTSKKSVYEMVEKADKENHDMGDTQNKTCQLIPDNIVTKNHHFDTSQRTRVRGSQKVGTIATDRNAIHKGALGVRWEKARCNQAKLLPTSKMGI